MQSLMMNETQVLSALICFGCVSAMALEQNATTSPSVSRAELEFDHVWIVVTRDAPERAALEKAGLKISPDVNRHDGQGTASITADFQNSYIELMWPDPTVSVAPGAERGVEKFKNRMNWRTSGWCPIGIGLHRLGIATPLPFPTWTIAPDWMPKGTAIEILTARDDTKSPSFFIEPDVLAVKEKGKIDNPKAGALQHEIGVQRITEIRLVRPKGYQPVAAFAYLEKARILQSSEGNEWAVEITFDGGQKSQTKDLRPDLPLVIHY
jgi:Glyoxalase-like domain